MTSHAVIDNVHEAFGEMHPDLIHSNLSAKTKLGCASASPRTERQ
jgi:hypothetical protein